jgi:formylglycine-generating enzyme required for sulfatase activity
MTDAMNLVASNTPPKAKIFISYSRKDIVFVDRLDAALRARGFEPLIDRAEIYAFEDWWKRIEGLISKADTIVFVLSPDAVASDICAKEVAFAHSLNKRFAPVVCRQVDIKTVPAELQQLNFIFCDDESRFNDSMRRLSDALETDIVWVRKHTDFGELTRRWSAANRPGGLLLRPPLLEEAEYWMAYRPHGAPLPTAEIQKFIADSRNAEVTTNRRKRFVQLAIYALLVAIIGGLVGWINQAAIEEQWRWFTVIRPYIMTEIRPYLLTSGAERTIENGQSFKECAKHCPEMVVIPAGNFMMGSPDDEADRLASENPRHRVTIAKPFAIGKFEVTFEEWDTCVALRGCPQVSDSGWGRGTRPVINVTWHDAKQYVDWLAKMTGKPYRLLTEAEWEYAARAETYSAYPWGNDIGNKNANCDGCGSEWDNKQTSPVGSFAPNGFGLFDMHGNVWEWVQDCYQDTYNGVPTDGSAFVTNNCGSRVVRGGAWIYVPHYLRSARRGWNTTDGRSASFGFRIGRTLAR